MADLALGNYGKLERDGRAGRLTAAELEIAVNEYGQDLVELPESALNDALVVKVRGSTMRWAVDIDLWSAEQGRTDLTLQIAAWLDGEIPRVEIEDIHVL